MDQAPRTAFIAAVVRPEERTGVMGITSMLRTLAMSVGPSITGLLSGNGTFWIAFLATGICRIIYDLGLWVLFVNVKVDKDAGRQDDVDSVDDEAWNGLLSDTDSDESSEGRRSKDTEDGHKSV
jgi:MFS family permease